MGLRIAESVDDSLRGVNRLDCEQERLSSRDSIVVAASTAEIGPGKALRSGVRLAGERFPVAIGLDRVGGLRTDASPPAPRTAMILKTAVGCLGGGRREPPLG